MSGEQRLYVGLGVWFVGMVVVCVAFKAATRRGNRVDEAEWAAIPRLDDDPWRAFDRNEEWGPPAVKEAEIKREGS